MSIYIYKSSSSYVGKSKTGFNGSGPLGKLPRAPEVNSERPNGPERPLSARRVPFER